MNADVAIVGGGLAGSAAAICLARSGRRVVLIERSLTAHHKVCGEFLSAEALGSLQALGIDVAALGAVAIRGVRVGGASGSSCAALPFEAMSLTRRRLDEALLHAAVQCGVQVFRGHRVEALQRDGDGWRAWLDDNESVLADTAFLATGKHDLRGQPRVKKRSWKLQSGLVGFKMYFRLAPEEAKDLSGYVELATYPGGYAGLQPVEDGAANLCCLIDSKQLRKMGGRWDDLLQTMQTACPQLQRRLLGAKPLLERPLAISSIPYGYLCWQSEEGLWPLGDQAAVIPSFTGDGMSIALHSGCLAAAMYGQGSTTEAYLQRLRGEIAGQVRLATLISRGIVWAPTRWAGITAVRHWPRLLGLIARSTRIPEHARLAAGPEAISSSVCSEF